jgi:hypothetical protein
MESLPDTEKIKPEVLNAQRALHGFIHNFCKENGVRAKPAVAQATSRGNGTGFLRSNMRSAQSNQSAAMH